MDNKFIHNILLLGVVLVIYFPLPITSQVCTVTGVSECLRNTSEYEKLASEKCSTACGNSEGDIKYKYHCMLDSTHKELLEMCAIPKYLFDFCPAYDRKGQRIQKDESRPCNSSSSRSFYNSSELFFCDLTSCLDSFTSTTSDSPSETTHMTTTMIPVGESWYLYLIWITVVISLIIGLIFFIWKRQHSRESFDCRQNPTPEENGRPDGHLLVNDV